MADQLGFGFAEPPLGAADQREQYECKLLGDKPYKAPRLEIAPQPQRSHAEIVAARGCISVELAQRGLNILRAYRQEHGADEEERLTTEVWLRNFWNYLADEIGLEDAAAFARAEARGWPTLGYTLDAWVCEWHAVRAAAQLQRRKAVQ